MDHRRLAIYVASVAAYEAVLGALYAWLPVGPPIFLDPRLPINWVCARFLDRIPSPLIAVLLLSFLWHVIVAAGLFRSISLVPVFAVGETILSVPALILYGSILLGFGGHGFTNGIAALAFLVFVVCNLVPMVAAYRLMLRSSRATVEHFRVRP